jgi:hypothetical protein
MMIFSCFWLIFGHHETTKWKSATRQCNFLARNMAKVELKSVTFVSVKIRRRKIDQRSKKQHEFFLDKPTM